MKTKPDLRITNPYALDDDPARGGGRPAQDSRRRSSASTGAPPPRRSTAFTSGDMAIGTTWLYQQNTLNAGDGQKVASVTPEGGRHGLVRHLDDLVKAKPTRTACTSGWTTSSRPRRTPTSTVYFGEAPVSAPACVEAEKLQRRPLRACSTRRTRRTSRTSATGTRRPGDVPRRPGRHLHRLRCLDQGLDRDHRQLSRPSITAPTDRSIDAPSATDLTTGQRRRRPPASPCPAAGGGALPPTAGPARRAAAGGAARLARHRLPGLAGVLFLVTSFWSIDSFTRQRRHRHRRSTTTRRIADQPDLPDDRGPDGRSWPRRSRSTGIVVAFPIAFYMARVASPRDARPARSSSILLPLWSGYLVKVYAWRADPQPERRRSTGSSRRSGSQGPGYSIEVGLDRRELPVAAVHDHPDLRRPRTDPELAARGVGRPRRRGRDRRSGGSSCRSSCRRSSPGSIFTFCADPRRLHHADPGRRTRSSSATSSTTNVGVAGNQPLAAAYAMVPVTIMLVYLLVARRLGAFEAL